MITFRILLIEFASATDRKKTILISRLWPDGMDPALTFQNGL
jgi:hypothetical protein